MDGFCRIEPGCYVMGAPRSEFFVGLYSDRQVQVTLTRPFELGETEVTRGQWFDTGWELPTQQGFCDTADCPECCLPDDCSSDDCPIYNVSLFDVLAFANHLSELRGLDPCYVLDDCTGEVGSDLRCESMMLTRDTLFECEGYRLPAESEWEYAARAGTKTAWFTGDIVPRGDGDCHEEAALEPVGWYCHNSGIRVHPVAQKLANPWGLYDTAGNVAEWVNDIYDPSGYGEGPHVDFAGQRLVDRNLVSAEEGSYTLRSSRSGMAHYMPYATKVNRQIPFFDDGYGVGLGFRLARTLDPQASP